MLCSTLILFAILIFKIQIITESFSYLLAFHEIQNVHPTKYSFSLNDRKRSDYDYSSKENKDKCSLNSMSIEGTRLNKCLNQLSRRAADEAILAGRVTVDGVIANPGSRVTRNSVVKLDGIIQNWEDSAVAKLSKPSSMYEDRSFIYLKYWKPRGVTCTSDRKDSTNIITSGSFDLFPQRLFTVGRLDKDSTGLILLTSDGRVNNALLNPRQKREKVYEVDLDRDPTDDQLMRMRAGIVITTTSQRDGKVRPVTAATLPCVVTRISDVSKKTDPALRRKLEIKLTEGRNRQIRRMMEALGLQVINLHRVSFAGIKLKGLAEGNWLELDDKEMEIIQKALVNTGAIPADEKQYQYDE
eukprot:gene7793-10587_t